MTDRRRRSESDIDPRVRALIEHTTDALLLSIHFRSSEQCKRFLRYVIHQSLKGDEESLRERIIGCEVFGRPADYDTAEDPIVRVRAADVRKRLAQFYQSDATGAAVVVAIPTGSYFAQFEIRAFAEEHPPAESSTPILALPHPPEVLEPSLVELQPNSKPARSLPLRFSVLLLCAVVALVAWQVAASRIRDGDSVLAFWEPLLKSPRPIMMCLGTGSVYTLSGKYVAGHQGDVAVNPVRVPLDADQFFRFAPNESLKAEEFIPIKDIYVSVGTVVASENIKAMLIQKNKSFDVRYGSDLSFGDLHHNPSILFGAFNNTWTLSTTSAFRFAFSEDQTIIDSQNKSVRWAATDDFSRDYAIVSRIVNSPTGTPLVIVAGIGQAGTRAAGEFVTQPAQLAAWTKQLPEGWKKKNIQVVLEVDVSHNTPVSTRVVADYVW